MRAFPRARIKSSGNHVHGNALRRKPPQRSKVARVNPSAFGDEGAIQIDREQLGQFAASTTGGNTETFCFSLVFHSYLTMPSINENSV